jgi:CDP-archaeol synthase
MSRWAAFIWRIENYARDLPFGVGNRDWGVLVGSGMQNRSNGRMAGDLFSSFLKRRMKLPPSSRAIGLDQVPESLFPLLACRRPFSLTAFDTVVTVMAFFIGEILISRILYKFRLRDRPY